MSIIGDWSRARATETIEQVGVKKAKAKSKPINWKRVLLTTIPVAVFLISAKLAGIVPISGRSMEPTIHQPIPLDAIGLQGWACGASVRIDKNAKPKIGQLVLFNSPGNEICVKRVEKINSKGEFWMGADGKGWTGEDSDNYGWVNSDNIMGVVRNVISPRTIAQSFSTQGRFRNWVEMNYSPNNSKWSLSGKILVVESKDKNISIFYNGNTMLKTQGIIISVDPVLSFYRVSAKEIRIYNWSKETGLVRKDTIPFVEYSMGGIKFKAFTKSRKNDCSNIVDNKDNTCWRMFLPAGTCETDNIVIDFKTDKPVYGYSILAKAGGAIIKYSNDGKIFNIAPGSPIQTSGSISKFMFGKDIKANIWRIIFLPPQTSTLEIEEIYEFKLLGPE